MESGRLSRPGTAVRVCSTRPRLYIAAADVMNQMPAVRFDPGISLTAVRGLTAATTRRDLCRHRTETGGQWQPGPVSQCPRQGCVDRAFPARILYRTSSRVLQDWKGNGSIYTASKIKILWFYRGICVFLFKLKPFVRNYLGLFLHTYRCRLYSSQSFWTMRLNSCPSMKFTKQL